MIFGFIGSEIRKFIWAFVHLFSKNFLFDNVA